MYKKSSLTLSYRAHNFSPFKWGVQLIRPVDSDGFRPRGHVYWGQGRGAGSAFGDPPSSH